jgi:prephenate dehydrogenase
VGSVKGEIVHAMERLLPKNIFFVAGHPIAGSEQWGAQAARAGLFVRRHCILTPTGKTDRTALAKIAALWRQVGASVEIMTPDLHDHVLGVISHLPHVLVYALVNALECQPRNGVDLKKYCAGGFKDFTRIASSRPELWRDICLMNRAALGRSLGGYIKYLQRIERCIRNGKGAALEKEFVRAYNIRAQIP